MSDFGTFLRQKRNEHGFSLSQITNAIGITNSRMSKIERNKIIPSIEDLKLIANLYDVSLIDILIHSGHLQQNDFERYQQCFKHVDLLDTDELKHIQQHIDFLTRYKAIK